MTHATPTTSELRATFHQLHASGFFVLPNPWDRGSARIMIEDGYPALATTSAGLGRVLGKDDQEVTRDELVAHTADLSAFIDVPLNVDSELLFPNDPGGITETVDQLADAGASGVSIEDFDPETRSILPIGAATEAVAEAAEACAGHGIVLTARAENQLYGFSDLDDTIERLQAYRRAGAGCLYAPGLRTAEEVARVVTEVDGPINVLALAGMPNVAELAELGVRRASTGSRLHSATVAALKAELDQL